MEPDSVYLTTRADCALTVSEACVAPELVTPYNVGRWCLSEDECIALGINFAAYERGVSDAADAFGHNPPLAAMERDAMRYRWLRDRPGLSVFTGERVRFKPFDCPHEIEVGQIGASDLDQAIDAAMRAERSAALTGADTEPHGPNELNSASAPGESADPQSQGDTQ